MPNSSWATKEFLNWLKSIPSSLISQSIWTIKSRFKLKSQFKLKLRILKMIYKSSRLKINQKLRLRRLKRQFTNGNRLTARRLCGWETRNKFMNRIISTSSRAWASNLTRQWTGYISILMVRSFSTQFCTSLTEPRVTSIPTIMEEWMT